MLVNDIERILLQCIHTSNHDAHFRYLTILFVKYISVKLKKNKWGWFRARVYACVREETYYFFIAV